MAQRSTTRKINPGEGDLFYFHGAFTEKKDAITRKEQTPGSFVRSVWYRSGMRYAVLSPRRENPGLNLPVVRWRKSVDKVHRTTLMRRSHHPAVRPEGPKKCAKCGSRKNVVLDHRNGNLKDIRRRNLRWLCTACNTKEGIRLKRAGKGKRHPKKPHELRPNLGGVVRVQTSARKPSAKTIVRARNAMKRSDLILAIRRAGFLNDKAEGTRLLLEHRISREVYDSEFRAGRRAAELAKKNPRQKNSIFGDLLRKLQPRVLRKKYGVWPRQVISGKKHYARAKGAKVMAKQGRPSPSLKLGPSSTASKRRPLASSATPIVVAQVASALRNQGFKPADAKKTAEAAYRNAGSRDFDSVFRAAMKRNPTNADLGFDPTLDAFGMAKKTLRKGLVKIMGHTVRAGSKRHQQLLQDKRRYDDLMRSETGKGRNPSAARKAADLYEKFHGTPSTEVIEVLEAEGVKPEVVAKVAAMVPPEDYAGLGELCELRVRTGSGEGVRITFGEKERPRLASNGDGDQLYFIGGDQDVSSLVKQGRSLGFALMDVGECFWIEYLSRKKFDRFQPVVYYHEFGEETGECPRLLFSPAHKRLYLVDGAYKVKPVGIVN